MNKPSILIVDDDMGLSALIAMALKDVGYRTHPAKSADAAFAYLKTDIPDLVLLDISLPGISGLKVLDLLKQEPKTSGLPVIMMTSQKETPSKVQGLEGGADDYIVKPFDTAELIARIGALLRRTKHDGKMRRVREIGKIVIDFDRQEVKVQGAMVDLSPAQFRILEILSEKPGHVVSLHSLRESLAENKDITSEVLYQHMKNLRGKLGAGGTQIETIYGTGYKLLDR